MPQPPITSSRSYTRPTLPSGPPPPPSLDPSSSSSRLELRRPSSQISSSSRTTTTTTHPPRAPPQDWDPRQSMNESTRTPSPPPTGGPTSATKPEEWAADEESMLQLYGLSSLSPSKWEHTGDPESDPALFTTDSTTTTTTTTTRRVKGDEIDPLGLISSRGGGILASRPELSPELRPQVLLHSKQFDPKVFLSSIHPNATFKDLNFGRERLKEGLEQRSGALKSLVQAEWDRFVGVKATTESE
jgi:exocyst complex component 2